MFVRAIALLTGVANGFLVNLTAPPLCNYTMPTSVKVGTNVPLCVYMMSGPVGNPTDIGYLAPQIKSIAFGAAVDTYSMLTLSGSFATFNSPTSDQDNLFAWMTAAPSVTAWPRECALQPDTPLTFPPLDGLSGVRSCPQLVRTISNAVPLASLVAVVKDGVIENLIWDNQCQTCPVTSDSCIGGNLALTVENTSNSMYLTANGLSDITKNKICSIPQTSCLSTNNATGVNCDFRVLLTWQGTDVKGNRLLSSTLRMTQFSGQSVGSMWNSVANSFDPNQGLNGNNTVDTR